MLLEVTLQQALQSLAVTGLVTGHLMDGVVDGVQAVLLGAGGQVELALGGTELAVNTPCQIVLGGGLHSGFVSFQDTHPAWRCLEATDRTTLPLSTLALLELGKRGSVSTILSTFGGCERWQNWTILAFTN